MQLHFFLYNIESHHFTRALSLQSFQRTKLSRYQTATWFCRKQTVLNYKHFPNRVFRKKNGNQKKIVSGENILRRRWATSFMMLMQFSIFLIC